MLLEEPGVCSEGGGSHLCKHTNITSSASPTSGTSLLQRCADGTPSLNSRTGPAGLGAKHLPWLGTEQDVDLGSPAPGKLSPTRWVVPARVSCRGRLPAK